MANPGNVIGGHKANLNNPNTSEESKQHSKEVLEQASNSGEIDTSSSSTSGSSSSSGSTEGKNPNNIAGGLKATISNPNTSQEAKDSAKERLDNM